MSTKGWWDNTLIRIQLNTRSLSFSTQWRWEGGEEYQHSVWPLKIWFFKKNWSWNGIFLTKVTAILTTLCRITEKLWLGGTCKGHLVTQGIAQDNVHMSRQNPNISKDRDTTTSLGNLLPLVLGPSQWKSVSGCSQGTSCVSHCLCPLLLAVIKHHWKEPGCIFFCALHSDICTQTAEISLSLPITRLNSPGSQLLLRRDTSDPATLW